MAWAEYYSEADRRRELMGGDVFHRIMKQRLMRERVVFAAFGAYLMVVIAAFIWLCMR